MDLIRRAAELISSSRKIAAFTGAGVSTESGIPDLRSHGGVWPRKSGSEIVLFNIFLLSQAGISKNLLKKVNA